MLTATHIKAIIGAIVLCLVLKEANAGKAPLFGVVDLNRNEAVQVRLSDGQEAEVKLLEVRETRDAIRSALREAVVTDGSKATGARVERRYEKPGAYSEVLKVVDARGRVGYDIATVQVFGRGQTNNFPPTIHAAYSPTFNIRAGDPVTLKVRTFRTTFGRELWDFGDGSAVVEAQSDGNAKPLGKDGYAVTQHRYENPGHYIARVERTNERGETAVARLVIEVIKP